MIKKISIKGKTLRNRVLVDEIELSSLSILYACNGTGKSSILDSLIKKDKGLLSDGFELDLEGDYNKIAYYKNSVDNHKHRQLNEYKKSFESEIMEKVYSNHRSEGENIMISILSFISILLEDTETDLVLFDEVDSGLSVEHVNIVFHHIRELVKQGKQVIFSCNTYHPIFITREFTNMLSGKIESCNSYEEFYGVAVESRRVLMSMDKIPKYISF